MPLSQQVLHRQELASIFTHVPLLLQSAVTFPLHALGQPPVKDVPPG